MQNAKILGIGLVMAAVVPAITAAGVVPFDDRASWLSAIGGVPDLEEDFSGFGADSPFRPEPETLMISMGTIGEVGTDQNFRNIVDVSPFLFADNNGTSHASCFTNFPDGDLGTNIEIVFNEPVGAWGADFSGAADGEILSVDIIEAVTGTVLGTLTADPADPTFLGFVADAGEEVGSVFLRSTNFNPGSAGKGFGMDNLAVVMAVGVSTIPTLSSIGNVLFLVLLAFFSVLVLRNAR